MPLLLFTYLLTEILAPFFASILIINGILFLGRLMQFLDTIFGFGIDLADFVRLCAYLAPNLLLFSIPMSSMIAVIVAFTRMSDDNEILAFKTAGIGLYRMLPPIIIFALSTAALTSLSSAYLIPSGTVAMKKMLFQLAKEKIDKGMQGKQFSDQINDVVIYVDQITPETKEWNGVYVSDLRDKKNPLTVIARTGNLDARIEEMHLTLELTDGSIHATKNDTTQTIRFEKYRLNLPLKTPESVAGESLTNIGKGGMTLSQLNTEAERLGKSTPQGIPLMIEYHKRLALPVGCFILSLIALPLALLRSSPGSRQPGLSLGLGSFLLYYILFTAAKGLSENATLPVIYAMWTPNIIFTLLAIYLLRTVARENPGIIVNSIFLLMRNILSLFPHRQGTSS
ncbi:MAG: LptF/LptG family permease [Proteobacteria bacterium]|nr:LptF/LptG family permease [Pseudomonadota bacterium]MBU1715448.1 LptF/LptG family permease [Pseudomonadota bacterium]